MTQVPVVSVYHAPNKEQDELMLELIRNANYVQKWEMWGKVYIR